MTAIALNINNRKSIIERRIIFKKFFKSYIARNGTENLLFILLLNFFSKIS